MSDQPKKSGTFPFKPLIWAIFGIVVLVIFKDEVSNLLTNAEEVVIWDKFSITVNSDDIDALLASEKEYQDKVKNLMEQLDEQQQEITHLIELQEQLEESIQDCPESEEASTEFVLQLDKIYENSNLIREDAFEIENISILDYSLE